MSRFLISILLPLLFAPNLGVAQTPRALVEGQRIRVAVRCKLAREQVTECHDSRPPRVITGRFQSVVDDTLRLRAQSNEAEVTIPMRSVAQLWVVDGTRGHFWVGAGIGLLAGAVIGGVLGSKEEFCITSCTSATGFGVLIGAPLGFLLGGDLGKRIRSDRWRSLPLDDLSVSVGLRLNAIGLRVSVAL